MNENNKLRDFDDSYSEESYRNSNPLAAKSVFERTLLDNARSFCRQSPVFFWLMCLFIALTIVFGPTIAYKMGLLP